MLHWQKIRGGPNYLTPKYRSSLKHQSHKIVKNSQTICRLLPIICLSVFDHFMELVLKGLKNATIYRTLAERPKKIS